MRDYAKAMPPQASMLGFYDCPLSFIAHEIWLAFEGASKGLRRAIVRSISR